MIVLALAFVACEELEPISEAEARTYLEDDFKSLCAFNPDEMAAQIDSRVRKTTAIREAEHWRFDLGDEGHLWANVRDNGDVEGPLMDFLLFQCGEPPDLIAIKDAENFIKKFFDTFNEYDEGGIERMTSPKVFPEIRTALLASKRSATKFHLQDLDILGTCVSESCTVRVNVSVSGLSVAGEDTDTLTIQKVDGDLILTAWQ